MLTHRPPSDHAIRARSPTRRTVRRFSAGAFTPRSWLAVAAVASLLSACAAITGPTEASLDAGRTETVRELRHIGPPGKSLPIFVNRETRISTSVGRTEQTADRPN